MQPGPTQAGANTFLHNKVWTAGMSEQVSFCRDMICSKAAKLLLRLERSAYAVDLIILQSMSMYLQAPVNWERRSSMSFWSAPPGGGGYC